MAPKFASFPITQGFGPTDEQLDSGGVNKGLDFGLPEGTAIDAAAGGLVLAAGDQGDGWGISVKVRDAEGNIHNYGHLSATHVRAGQRVSPGTVLGKSGNTGKSTGPHLSYDVSDKDGNFFDPSKFVGLGPGAGPRRGPDDLSPDDEDALGPSGGSGDDGTNWYGPTTTAQQRVDALGKAGYRWKGNRFRPDTKGKDAQWVGPNGETVREEDALRALGSTQRREALDPNTSVVDILNRALRAEAGKKDPDPKVLTQLATALRAGTDVQQKQLRLDDGTVITQEMIQHADPVTREQYQMELDHRRSAYANEATGLLNKYNLDQYTASRNATNDANANANNDFRNRMEAIRSKLDLDELTIDQAAKEVDRMLRGMGESRSRAQLETETALKAAPFATRDGKTSFTGNDLGASVSGLARIGGIATPETTPLISFPGTTRVDPRAAMQQGDEALGVTGALPEIPKITVNAGQIPNAPTLQQGPAAPRLQMPVMPPRIQLPVPLPAKTGNAGLNAD